VVVRDLLHGLAGQQQRLDLPATLWRLFVNEFECLLECGVGLPAPCPSRSRGRRRLGSQETDGTSNPGVIDTLVAASAVPV
jgi:hypothetical protein